MVSKNQVSFKMNEKRIKNDVTAHAYRRFVTWANQEKVKADPLFHSWVDEVNRCRRTSDIEGIDRVISQITRKYDEPGNIYKCAHKVLEMGGTTVDACRAFYTDDDYINDFAPLREAAPGGKVIWTMATGTQVSVV